MQEVVNVSLTDMHQSIADLNKPCLDRQGFFIG